MKQFIKNITIYIYIYQINSKERGLLTRQPLFRREGVLLATTPSKVVPYV